jgi:hypothetical protein
MGVACFEAPLNRERVHPRHHQDRFGLVVNCYGGNETRLVKA